MLGWFKRNREIALPKDENVVYLQYSDLPIHRVLKDVWSSDLENISVVGRKKDGSMQIWSTHAKRESTVWDFMIGVDGVK